MLDVQAAAQANNKAIIIGESWLYKISNTELSAGTHYIHIFPRDVFDFWIPLDIRFLPLSATPWWIRLWGRTCGQES